MGPAPVRWPSVHGVAEWPGRWGSFGPEPHRPHPNRELVVATGSSKTDARTAAPKKRLSEQVSDVLRRRHYSPRTEKTYIHWMSRFVRFHAGRSPAEMGSREVVAYLTHLAVDEHVSAATQRQAFSALLFLYRTVLGRELEGIEAHVRAKPSRHVPTVLSRAEVRAVLGEMSGRNLLVATLLYGSGLRLIECLRLRIKDLDWERHQLCIRQGKGRRDRYTTLPRSIPPALTQHVESLRTRHQRDLKANYRGATLPNALEKNSAAPPRTGRGSGYSGQRDWFTTLEPTNCAATTFMNRHRRKPHAPLESTSASPRTLPAIHSRPTSSSPAPTSAPCKSCSATETSRQP